MISTEGDFLDRVGVDVPKVAVDILMTHRGEETHITTHLVVVFGLRRAELEVYDNPLAAVSHNSVWALLNGLAVSISGEDGTLVIERPTPREPVCYTCILKSFAQ